MHKFTVASAIALGCALTATPATAASARTAVSGLGNDANPCTLARPCRTLQAAFNATAPNGEIDVLDPAGYGPLTITHGISIQGHGWASLNGSGVAIITISAGGADHVSLQGLILDGFDGQSIGVEVNSVGVVTIEDTVIRSISSRAIFFVPNAEATLVVTNSILSDTVQGYAVEVSNNSVTPSHVELSGVSFISNAAGLLVELGKVAIKNCIFVGSGGEAITAQGGPVRISDSLIANNGGIGLHASSSGSATLDRTQFSDNGSGDWSGNVTSYGNNAMDQAGPPLTGLK